MKAKVLLIQQVIPSYRIPIFNLLAESVALTVVYDPAPVPEGARFAVKRSACFTFRRGQGLSRRTKEADAGIYVVINSYDTPFTLRADMGGQTARDRALFTGASALQRAIPRATHTDDQNKRFYDGFCARPNAWSVMTSDYPTEKFAAQGWPREMLFYRPNTCLVQPDNTPRKKDTLLFWYRSSAKGFDESWNKTNCRACRENAGRSALVIIGRTAASAGASRHGRGGTGWPNAWNSPAR